MQINFILDLTYLLSFSKNFLRIREEWKAS